jgi:hypothetical protein
MIRKFWLLAPLATLSCLASTAQAQSWRQNNNALVVPGTMPDPGAVQRRLGTRLEPGAVLCHTAEDLQARLVSLTRQNAGEEGSPVTAGCVMVSVRIPVEVLERHGPLTKVKTLGRSEEIGWTDAWLPDRRG